MLTELAEGDLEKLGLPLEPRMKLLKAIVGLSGKRTATKATPCPRPLAPEAEDPHHLTVMGRSSTS